MKKHFDILFVALLIGVLLIVVFSCKANSTSDEPPITESTTAPAVAESTSAVTVFEPTTEPEEPSEPELISLGEFRLTAYCGCTICCGKYGENRPVDSNGKPIVLTANGTVAVEGVTVAADTNLLPFGTEIYIDGHPYIVQDRGGVIKENRVDIYFEDHQDALNFGVQYKEIFIERKVENND